MQYIHSYIELGPSLLPQSIVLSLTEELESFESWREGAHDCFSKMTKIDEAEVQVDQR